MASSKAEKKVCPKGHTFYKSSDCPSCPICEEARKPNSGVLSIVSAPARRSLENEGIKTFRQLSQYSEAQILKLHGMGPGSMPTLRKALKAVGLSFRKA